MKMIYPAVFHFEDNAYWVEFPDLPGCQSFGSSLTETLDNAREALEAYAIPCRMLLWLKSLSKYDFPPFRMVRGIFLSIILVLPVKNPASLKVLAILAAAGVKVV